MPITIRYQRIGFSKPSQMEVPESDYYDELEYGESFMADGVAKYLDPHVYLELDPEDLDWLEVTEPQESNGSNTFRYQYLDGMKVFSVHAAWANGDEELIHTVDIEDDKTLITRTLKRPDQPWEVVTCFIASRDDSTSLIRKNAD